MNTILNRINLLRGLAALAVFIGHIIKYLSFCNKYILLISNIADLAVCYFFMISAMGLAYAYDNKKDYLKGFLKRKIIYVLGATIICMITSELLYSIIHISIPNIYNLIWNIAHIRWNWYINEIILFYILFYCAYRFIQNTKMREIAIVLGITIICIGFLLEWKYGSWDFRSRSYYTTAYSFALGILLYDYWDKFEAIIRKRPFLFGLALFCLACICLYSYSKPSDSFGYGVLMKNCIGICLMLLLCDILIYFDIEKLGIVTKLINYLSKISFEIFLYNSFALSIVIEKFQNDFALIFLTGILTIILSDIMHRVNKILKV